MRRLTIVVVQRIGHCVNSIEKISVQRVLATGFSDTLQAEEGRKRVDDRIEDRNAWDMEAATANLKRGAQFFLNDGE